MCQEIFERETETIVSLGALCECVCWGGGGGGNFSEWRVGEEEGGGGGDPAVIGLGQVFLCLGRG